MNYLEKISNEHRDGILFADKIAKIAETGDEAMLVSGIEMVHEYNDRELEEHLQHEEQTILMPLVQQHKEHMDLCITLGKEHGLLRTLVEGMTPQTARKDLADFARVLKAHTLLEDEKLLPLLDSLFTQEQLGAILNFTPLQRQEESLATAKPVDSHDDQEWLLSLKQLKQHHDRKNKNGGSVVLFPFYRPDLAMAMAGHLGLEFFDYQQEVMSDLGVKADSISLSQMEEVLQNRAKICGIFAHNIESLLCVKSEEERRTWLRHFLTLSFANPVLIPISVFQADVPAEHDGVCDLELNKMPKTLLSSAQQPEQRMKYDV